MTSFRVMLLSLTMVFSGLGCGGKEKDYADVPLEQIGVTPVEPAQDPNTGFTIGGRNSTELIRKLTEINGRKIADLERDMRPGTDEGEQFGFFRSTEGFLGKEEKLLDVLVMDNELVVDKLGLTHQDLARPLLIAAAIGRKSASPKRETTFRYRGQQYRIKMICYKGSQYSPFYDKTSTSCDAELENLTNNKKLRYSPLVPHMIERYGFYEGKGTPYRIEPTDVMELFPFLKDEANSKRE